MRNMHANYFEQIVTVRGAWCGAHTVQVMGFVVVRSARPWAGATEIVTFLIIHFNTPLVLLFVARSILGDPVIAKLARTIKYRLIVRAGTKRLAPNRVAWPFVSIDWCYHPRQDDRL